MFLNINDYTTNGFVNALTNNTTIINNGLTAYQILQGAGVNFTSTRQVGGSTEKTQEHKLYQYYSLNFDDWYYIAKWALQNVTSGVPATAKYAQQLSARFIPLYSQSIDSLNSIASASAKVHSELSLPVYNFVPNMSSIFTTRLYGRTFTISGNYRIDARVPVDFASNDLILGIYDETATLVEQVSATVNSEGFVSFDYVPTLVSSGHTYFFALKQFTIFVPAVYGTLVANVNARTFHSFGGAVAFVAV